MSWPLTMFGICSAPWLLSLCARHPLYTHQREGLSLQVPAGFFLGPAWLWHRAGGRGGGGVVGAVSLAGGG